MSEKLIVYGDIHIAKVRIKDSPDVHWIDVANKKILLSGTVNNVYPRREKNNLDYWEEGFLYAMYLIKPNFWREDISLTQEEFDEFLKSKE